MTFSHLSLLELIEGASDQQIEAMMPEGELGTDISQWYSIDYTPSKKRRRLMRDAYLAMKRGHGEEMRRKLLGRLEAAMFVGLTNGFRKSGNSRGLRQGVRKSRRG